MIIASIDIGTNTALLLIARVEKDKTLTPLLEELRMPRIGKGLKPGSPINNEQLKLLYKYLAEYNEQINKYNCDKVIVTATNGLRIASNSDEVVDKIKNDFGWNTNIISGEEEARYSFLGAVSLYNDSKSTLVIDIGGGSTELVYGDKNYIKFSESFPIGSVSATEKYFKNNPPDSSELAHLEVRLHQVFLPAKDKIDAPERVIAIAGTPTTLACVIKNLKHYNQDEIEGTVLSNREIFNQIKSFSSMTSDEIGKKYPDLMQGRQDIILAGAYILYKINNLLGLDNIIVSARGIRYGAIIDYLSNHS